MRSATTTVTEEGSAPTRILNAAARWLEAHTAWMLPLLASIYAAIWLHESSGKFLWSDELYTLYIAQMPSLRQILHSLGTLDLNPPLQYLLTRLSLGIFGDHDFAVRLPSFLGFLAAWAALFFYMRRRSSALWATAAVLLLWLTPALPFAWEARPYALLLGLLAMLVYVWSLDEDNLQPWSRFALLLLLSAGLFLTHLFALFALLPLLAAQTVRCIRIHRADGLTWLALLAPAALDIPLWHRAAGGYQQIVYPAFVLARPSTAARYYLHATLLVEVAIFSLVAGLLFRSLTAETRYRVPVEDHIFAITLAAMPALVIAVFIVQHRPFADRYALFGDLGMVLCAVFLLQTLARNAKTAGFACILCSLVCLPVAVARGNQGRTIEHKNGYFAVSATIQQTAPQLAELPLVVAHAETVIDMSRRDPALSAQAVFLLDRGSAIRYTHLSLHDDGMTTAAQGLPLRSRVEPYAAFIAAHPHFLLLSSQPNDVDDAEEWVTPKLRDDGASLRIVARARGAYPDTTLFEVTMPSR